MTKKKNLMEKEVEKTEGEQLDLIDVQPENSKAIVVAARLYKKYQAARQSALNDEVAQKQEILRLVKQANMPTLEGGKIRFKCDGLYISITPRDELVTVKEETE